jgi:two-component system, sensor histidine kinase PdtaS
MDSVFYRMFEFFPDGILSIDGEGRIAHANGQAERMFGYGKNELLGCLIESLVPRRFVGQHVGSRDDYFKEPRTRSMGEGLELFGRRKDDTEFPIDVMLSALEGEQGPMVLCVARDISERKRAERLIVDSLREKEVLLKEIHHRVKNNLQVISSLINMQTWNLRDPASRAALEECQSRVMAIALIHEKLYQSRDYSRVPFSDYGRSLAANIFHTTGVSPQNIRLNVEFTDLSLAVDKAIPCGLILNELITNALKHAFPNDRQGTIRVVMQNAGPRVVELVVTDDGAGMDPAFDAAKATSLGMQLIYTLVEQLEGKLEIFHEGGTSFQVRFPVDGME